MSDSIFKQDSLGDLGVGFGYGDKQSVDMSLQQAYLGPVYPCLLCGRQSSHRIMPKQGGVNSAEIQQKGYICTSCLSTNRLDKKDFGIRSL